MRSQALLAKALKEHGYRIKQKETRKLGLLHTHRVNGNIKPQTATIHPASL